MPVNLAQLSIEKLGDEGERLLVLIAHDPAKSPARPGNTLADSRDQAVLEHVGFVVRGLRENGGHGAEPGGDWAPLGRELLDQFVGPSRPSVIDLRPGCVS